MGAAQCPMGCLQPHSSMTGTMTIAQVAAASMTLLVI